MWAEVCLGLLAALLLVLVVMVCLVVALDLS